jgi:UDP-N-acetylglucosamine--N-acetylmuramyl-(pentapeptide) pyrophosphoryl-undecaprenol N-acetylglucosamine transferase
MREAEPPLAGAALPLVGLGAAFVARPRRLAGDLAVSGLPRIVIAGGGTGGHVMPGLAVARELRAAGAAVTFVGTARGLEARLAPAAGFELRLITIGGLKSGSAARRLRTLGQLPAAVWQGARILRETRAQAVLGIGGYASGPVLAAAGLMRVPAVVLEVNARSGLANRLAARWVRAAAVNFAETARDYRHAVVTGIPVRAEFFRAAEQAPDEPPLVLVTGGSQGARAINAGVGAMAPQVGFRILHQTGAAEAEAIARGYEALGGRARAAAFLEDMAAAMAAASLVVCRAGASTLGELAAARRPAILIPYPAATDQHQLRNAEALARAGAARLLEQRELTPERLAAACEELLAKPEERAAMAAALGGFAHRDAAGAIARMVTEAAG